MAAAETLRAREVYRYYQPRNHADSPLPESSSRDTTNPTNFNTQQSFSDTALTAFAQLIALRLEAQRAIVSLIDHENEYFLAESTSTFSLIDGEGPEQNASLSISGARVPRAASLCEETLRLVPSQETAAEMTPVHFVPDLHLEVRMCGLDCVKGPPYLRFYCGVALTNTEGIKIGCVYVVDDRPRSEFSLEQAQFLTKMAATIMDYLENIRTKEDVVRVTQMSQALHAFIEGDGTMDGDWQRLKRYNLPSGSGVGYHWETNKDDGASSYINGKKELGPSTPLQPHPGQGSGYSMNQGQSPLQHTGHPQDARYNFNNSPWSSTSDVPQIPTLNSVFDGADIAAPTLAGSRNTEFSDDGFSNLLRATFSRASNLVREGMEVDGAVFFDAPFRFYQGRSTLETDPRHSQTPHADCASESEDEQVQVRPGPRPQVVPSQDHSQKRDRHPQGSRKSEHQESESPGIKSEVLGFSTIDSSSWKNQKLDGSQIFTAIDQSLLTSLVKRYPQGELFVFDEHGPVATMELIKSTHGSEVTIVTTAMMERRARQDARKRAEILCLLDAFPGARQIFFVPLYDSISGCFIGSFAWSRSLTRIFSIENHLSYLIAFGHSVMSEVSRLNTLSADRAKGDFISNVSHELRSPLHGILASVEFLADTCLNGFQRNLVDTVDICGRTLLDSIESVLDFSKIKRFGQQSMQPTGIVADLDVSSVIEEVLEGLFAGFEFNGLSSEGLADTTKSHSRDAPIGTESGASPSNNLQTAISNALLTVILDVDYRDWKFPTVPGTWRRLTMNIFSNALKYTPVGYIKVKLEARSITPVNSNVKNDGIERSLVTLTISDTGQGISSDFLKSKLFMPFSQEDATTPGTGLGMSMVKQIVDLSGGRIGVRSEKGKGTEVTLSLPLENCVRETEDSRTKLDPIYTHEDPIIAVRRRAKGRTVKICGFECATKETELQHQAMSDLKASIEKYVQDWLNLTIATRDEATDIVLCNESGSRASSMSGGDFTAMLVLCSNRARRDVLASSLGPDQTIEFVSKPCGPHRLAKAFLNFLDTEDARKTTSGQGVHSKPQDKVTVSSTYSKGLPTGVRAYRPSRLIGDLQSTIGVAPAGIRTTGLSLPAVIESSSTLRRRVSLSGSLNEVEIRLSKAEMPSASSMSTSAMSSTTAVSSLGQENPESGNTIKESPSVTRVPRMLLVEDNPVNMMLLATYMKKNKWEFETAANGLIALEAYQNQPGGFDVIFMDVSMPVMTGYESTRLIRKIERERTHAYNLQKNAADASPFLSPGAPSLASFPFSLQSSYPSNTTSPSAFWPTEPAPRLTLNAPALIIALTGFSSKRDQEMAFEAGVDVFMTKPVRFREVGAILEGSLRDREVGGEGEG